MDADREDGVHILRLEQDANYISIPVPVTRIQQVGHKRDMTTTSQRYGLVGVTGRDLGFAPHLDVGSITHTLDETFLEKKYTIQNIAPCVRNGRGCHSLKDVAIREVFGPNKSRTKRDRILEQSPALLRKHFHVEQV
jgi:hypothetical protein